MSRRRKISVAIPIYNEESGLPELFRRVTAVLAGLNGWDYEIVFVDDGSSDGSLEWLAAMAAVDPQVKVVAFSRNFGHQAALTAALDHISGDVVILMDGDLQDEPEVIPHFLAEYESGYEVVYAIRQERQENWLLRACYDSFYRIISLLADIELPQGAGDFGLLSRRVVEQMKCASERHRYLRGLRTWVGFRQRGLPVARAARRTGTSKYSLRKLLQLAFDGIFSFSVIPLRAATVLGGLTVVASSAFSAYALFAKLVLGQQTVGFTALILAITFLAGVQLLFLGVIGEYIGRIYQEVKHRPHYVVDRLIQCSTPAAADTHAIRTRTQEPLEAANHG